MRRDLKEFLTVVAVGVMLGLMMVLLRGSK